MDNSLGGLPEVRVAIESISDLRAFAAELDCTGDVPTSKWQVWLDAFADVKEPTFSYDIQLITLSSSGGGTSRKPGHILLNWRRLFDVIPDVSVASAGIADDSPFVRGLVGLYVWNKVWRGSEEPLSDAEASIIETLWLEAGRKVEVSSDDAYLMVNDARIVHGLDALTSADFNRAIRRLSTMKCIEIKGDNIWLREWVRRRT